MAIRIKNLENGRTIVVKNQDNMNKLKQTDDSFDFSDPYDGDQNFQNGFDLNRFDDKDKQDYINRFSFDAAQAGPDQKQTPKQQTTDVYYDFDGGDGDDDATDQAGDQSDDQSNGYDIGDFDMNEPLDDSAFGDEFDYGDADGQDADATQEEQPSDLQGEIRSVTGANLVYKRQNQDGTFNELWVYTVGKDMQAEFAIRKAILSGTDVDPNTQQSDDGSQRALSKTVGNVQFIQITGLPQ